MSTTCGTDESTSPKSSSTDVSDLSSPELPQQPQPLKSLPSKPDFPVDKVAHTAVQQEWVLPGLPLPGRDSLGEWASAIQPGVDVYLPPSFVQWPTLEMPAPVDFAHLVDTSWCETAKPVEVLPAVCPLNTEMPAPVDFGFLMAGQQPEMPMDQPGESLPDNTEMPSPVMIVSLLDEDAMMPAAEDAEFQPNGPSASSATGEKPLSEELSEFLKGCEEWTDTFVQDEGSRVANSEDLALADTFVEKELSAEQQLTSQAGNLDASLNMCMVWRFASMK